MKKATLSDLLTVEQCKRLLNSSIRLTPEMVYDTPLCEWSLASINNIGLQVLMYFSYETHESVNVCATAIELLTQKAVESGYAFY